MGTDSFEAIVLALPVTAPLCVYFIIALRIISGRTIILGPYINKKIKEIGTK
ncbi:hypothetical protein KAS31_00625 [Candidatus Parcubacteria bacterium]|nr:hypothetical protein [Candidatus Parcubacteria bacterium]